MGDTMLGVGQLRPSWATVYEVYEQTKDYRRVASDLGMNYNTVRGYVSKARACLRGVENSAGAETAGTKLVGTLPVEFPAAVYTARVPDYITPVYTGYGRYEVDRAIICGDVHIPCTDWSLAERMCEVAVRRKIDTLFVIGDFWNLDALSRYDHIAPPCPLAVELDMGSRLMMRWRQVFSRIVVRLGNHDVRLHKQVAGGVSHEMMTSFLDAGHGVEYAPYGHVEILSGGQRWRATHPSAYSRLKLRTADDLAQKYQCNVISWHEHHAGKTRDKYNRYTIINGGGLFDADKFAYVNLFDNTLPTMNQGFVLLEDGWADVLTPYPSMTRWDMWL